MSSGDVIAENSGLNCRRNRVSRIYVLLAVGAEGCVCCGVVGFLKADGLCFVTLAGHLHLPVAVLDDARISKQRLNMDIEPRPC